jgi:hypothetical protein
VAIHALELKLRADKDRELEGYRHMAFKCLVDELPKALLDLNDFDQSIDPSDDGEKSVKEYRKTMILDLLSSTCACAINPRAGDQLEVQKTALEVLLTPRRAFGLVNWSNTMRQVVMKMPGGKLLVREGGPWFKFRNIYNDSLIHEADALMYLFLCALTLDAGLVQFFLVSPSHIEAVIKLHEEFTRLLEMDRDASAAFPDEACESANVHFDSKRSTLLGVLVKTDGFQTKKTRNIADMEAGNTNKEVTRVSLSLMRDMRSRLHV